MGDCVFCKLYKENKEVIYKNKYFCVMFDNSPVTPGHLIVYTKRHIVSMLDLSKKEWAALLSTIKHGLKIINKADLEMVYKKMIENPLSEESEWYCRQGLKTLKKMGSPKGYNFGVNDGREAGRTIDHFHLHIIPRYEGDMKDPTGGVRNVIPTMGNYKLKR